MNGGKCVGSSDNMLFVFSIKIANVGLRKYSYVLGITIALFHPNGCTSNTPSLPHKLMLSLNKTTHRYLPNSDTHQLFVSKPHTQQRLKPRIEEKICAKHSLIFLVVKTVRISVEGKELFGLLQSLSVFSSGPCRAGDILIFKGSKVNSKAVPFVQFSDLSYGVHLPNIVR